MGRGKHPLRGRWKEGARQQDITLNLSPDAPRPPGEWAEIVWQPDSLWVARWQDKLSGKMKYVWLSDTAPVKQAREAAKFDRARSLNARLEEVRERIEQDLSGPDPKRRMIATACYLIDALCLRVGDEKDPDEADTVGATTLRPEHVTLQPEGKAEFRFLGKDSVLWHKSLALPAAVAESLAELIRSARPSKSSGNGDRGHPTRDLPQLFPDISSRDVNAYLGSILPGLTAKVFRTHHATLAVRTGLEASGIEPADPDYRKWEAASLANLDAAVLCNHTRQVPAGWSRSREKLKERQERAEERAACLPRAGQDAARAACSRPGGGPREKEERPSREAEADPGTLPQAGRCRRASPGQSRVSARGGTPRPGQVQVGGIRGRQEAHLEPGHQPQVVHRSARLPPLGPTGRLRRAGTLLSHGTPAQVRLGARSSP